MVRPYALKFFQKLSRYYEIVVFTAAMPDVSSLNSEVRELDCRRH